MSITPAARKRSTLAVGRRIARPKLTPFSSAVIPYHCDAAPRALSSPIRCVVPDFGLPPAMANKRAQYFHRVAPPPSLQSCRYVSFFCRLSLDSHIVAHQIPASRLRRCWRRSDLCRRARDFRIDGAPIDIAATAGTIARNSNMQRPKSADSVPRIGFTSRQARIASLHLSHKKT